MSVSVKSVSIVRSTGRSISHDSPVSLSINLSVSVGACTKNNTRPTRALTSAVRPFIPSTSSSLSLRLLPSSLSCVCIACPRRRGREIALVRAERRSPSIHESHTPRSLVRGCARETNTCGRIAVDGRRPRGIIHADAGDVRKSATENTAARMQRNTTRRKRRGSGMRDGRRCTDDRAGFLERS